MIRTEPYLYHTSVIPYDTVHLNDLYSFKNSQECFCEHRKNVVRNSLQSVFPTLVTFPHSVEIYRSPQCTTVFIVLQKADQIDFFWHVLSYQRIKHFNNTVLFTYFNCEFSFDRPLEIVHTAMHPTFSTEFDFNRVESRMLKRYMFIRVKKE